MERRQLELNENRSTIKYARPLHVRGRSQTYLYTSGVNLELTSQVGQVNEHLLGDCTFRANIHLDQENINSI